MRQFVLLLSIFFLATAATAQTNETLVRVPWGEPSPVISSETFEAAVTLSAMASLTTDERKTLFAASTSHKKAGLWQVHLRTFLIEHPDLSEDQKHLVWEAIDLAQPALYEVERGKSRLTIDVDEDALEQLTAKVKISFPPTLAAEAFAHLGPPEQRPIFFMRPGHFVIKPEFCDATVSGDDCMNNLDMDEGGYSGGGGGGLPTCSCNTWQDYCGLLYKCTGGSCYWRSWGCGTLWAAACTGLCKLYNSCGCP